MSYHQVRLQSSTNLQFVKNHSLGQTLKHYESYTLMRMQKNMTGTKMVATRSMLAAY